MLTVFEVHVEPVHHKFKPLPADAEPRTAPEGVFALHKQSQLSDLAEVLQSGEELYALVHPAPVIVPAVDEQHRRCNVPRIS